MLFLAALARSRHGTRAPDGLRPVGFNLPVAGRVQVCLAARPPLPHWRSTKLTNGLASEVAEGQLVDSLSFFSPPSTLAESDWRISTLSLQVPSYSNPHTASCHIPPPSRPLSPTFVCHPVSAIDAWIGLNETPLLPSSRASSPDRGSSASHRQSPTTAGPKSLPFDNGCAQY
ncbi:conserved hypothetical protein [Coccidioides posadasii str. Silveira]|uniref:Uncharacterized protein n=1 Tax=Coccidioides posadasii (strain RMSCC 757 / Silveira) TaxID=443226 RepID=E9CVF5_COCPS|nr:conserved hypothetical protein [Coccidioides posadasii str. Silveira]